MFSPKTLSQDCEGKRRCQETLWGLFFLWATPVTGCNLLLGRWLGGKVGRSPGLGDSIGLLKCVFSGLSLANSLVLSRGVLSGKKPMWFCSRPKWVAFLCRERFLRFGEASPSVGFYGRWYLRRWGAGCSAKWAGCLGALKLEPCSGKVCKQSVLEAQGAELVSALVSLMEPGCSACFW